MTLKNLIKEAEKLPRQEQEELLDALICMLGTDEADVALTPAQAQDLHQRMADIDSGKTKLIPGDEAIRRLRNRT
jgi:putative addiction module component (TIGR02574 family)